MSVRAPVNGDSSTPTAEQGKLLYPVNGSGASNPSPGASVSAPPSDDVSRPEPTEDFFRNAFLLTRGIQEAPTGEAPPAGDKQESSQTEPSQPGSESAGVEGEKSSGDTASAPQVPAKSEPPAGITLTQEELDRRVQAETDRRIAKQNRDSRARQAQEEEDRLLQTDPYGYTQKIREKRQTEAEQQKEIKLAVDLAETNMRAIDASVLDPIFLSLPESEMQKIVQEIEIVGIPGRGKAVEAALKSLERHWKSQGVESARETLMKDQGFVKEILTRFGGQQPEVEHVSAMGASSGPPNDEAAMNDWMRNSASQVRQRRFNS